MIHGKLEYFLKGGLIKGLPMNPDFKIIMAVAMSCQLKSNVIGVQ